jgi:5''-nucleotidase/2'',3''-cyclic phosphodiesterase and related esterases
VALADGSPLLPDKVYRVAVNDFLAAGGDGYDMIKAAARHIDTYRQIREVLADAVRKAGVIQFQDDGRLRVRELSSRAARFIAA